MIHEQHVGWVSAARAAAVFGVLMGIAAAGAVRGQGVGAVPAQAVGWDQVPAILARIVPPAFPARDFPITAFGAAPGGEADSKPAMDRAIAACAEAGGGRVVVPAGEWLIRGPIHLKSHVNLHLAEGATVNFSTDPADFEPLVHTRFEGTELMNFSPLVYAYGQENIAVTGAGTLHGRAGPDNWWAWKGSDSNASTTEARRLGEIDMPVRERISAAPTSCARSWSSPTAAGTSSSRASPCAIRRCGS